MVAAISASLADCVGCAEYVPPSGLEVVALGLVVSAAVVGPFALLHRFLRSRGR